MHLRALMIKQSAGRCFNWVYLLNTLTATLTPMTIKRVSNLNEYVTRRLGKEMWINDEEREVTVRGPPRSRYCLDKDSPRSRSSKLETKSR